MSLMTWMRGHDVSVVDALVIAGVGGGLASSVLAPSRVATLVELAPWAVGHRTRVIAVVTVLVAVAVARFGTVWGPVRVDPATARWTMSGPASRTPMLRRRLWRAVGVAVVAASIADGALALLVPSEALGIVGLGALAGSAGIAVAYLGQVRRDRRVGNRSAAGRGSGGLHRISFAPRDGLAGAVGLAVTMMDTSWITDARVTRWCGRWTAVARGGVPRSPAAAFLVVDLRRLRRHPEAIVRWLAWTLTAVACPVVLQFHHVPMLIPAVAVFAGGVAVSGGLVTAGDPVLRRAFGVADRDLLAGSVAAVIRRATRPPLPFDSPAVIDSVVSGAAFQPELLAAQMRGPLLAVVTGLLVGAVG